MITLREMGNLSVTDIDTHAVAKTATITRATYKLQDDGLVNIFTSQKDGRVSIGELTEKGKLTIVDMAGAENTIQIQVQFLPNHQHQAVHHSVPALQEFQQEVFQYSGKLPPFLFVLVGHQAVRANVI